MPVLKPNPMIKEAKAKLNSVLPTWMLNILFPEEPDVADMVMPLEAAAVKPVIQNIARLGSDPGQQVLKKIWPLAPVKPTAQAAKPAQKFLPKMVEPGTIPEFRRKTDVLMDVWTDPSAPRVYNPYNIANNFDLLEPEKHERMFQSIANDAVSRMDFGEATKPFMSDQTVSQMSRAVEDAHKGQRFVGGLGDEDDLARMVDELDVGNNWPTIVKDWSTQGLQRRLQEMSEFDTGFGNSFSLEPTQNSRLRSAWEQQRRAIENELRQRGDVAPPGRLDQVWDSHADDLAKHGRPWGDLPPGVADDIADGKYLDDPLTGLDDASLEDFGAFLEGIGIDYDTFKNLSVDVQNTLKRNFKETRGGL